MFQVILTIMKTNKNLLSILSMNSVINTTTTSKPADDFLRMTEIDCGSRITSRKPVQTKKVHYVLL